MAALYIDIDGFKQINDTFGHPVGDRFLELVAARLRGVVRGRDTAARLAGDEFAVLVEDGGPDPVAGDGDAGTSGAEILGRRILELLSAPYDLTAIVGRQLTVSASIGIARGLEGDAEQLLADADLALYAAKEAGKNRLTVFRPGLQDAAHDRMALALDLRDALREQQLSVVYQPFFDLRTEQIAGVEALVRWTHPTRGPIEPSVFVPIAESDGLIEPIGRWVLQTACRQAAAWREEGMNFGVAVNVSGRQLDSGAFADHLSVVLEHTGLPASALTLEITETALMSDPEATAAELHRLKALGVTIALDDFGTGYSSLTYLQKFPIDVLKIDQTFVRDLGDDSTEPAVLLHTLITLGRSMGMLTLGEGIERPDQLAHLKGEECDFGQGYLFCRPLTSEQLRERIRSGWRLHVTAG